MNIRNWFKRAHDPAENPNNPISWMGGRDTKSGALMSEERALNLSAVRRAVNAIASQVATLPRVVYKRTSDGGKERVPDHPVAELLEGRPNAFMTPSTLFHTGQTHALLPGNGYVYVERNNAAQPVGLWPLRPSRVGVATEEHSDGRVSKAYALVLPDGSARKLSADDVIHVHGLSDDGLLGRSVLAKARESLGLTAALEEYGSRFFGRGANSSVVIQFPQGVRLGDKTVSALRENWAELQEGLSNSHKTVILQDGATIDKLSIPPDDAQFLESRKFQTIEVARWFDVPPHLLYDLERATFSNIEQQSLEFVQQTLTPWLTRWEEELSYKLFSGAERKAGFFVEFLVDGLLRGDNASRGEFYSKLFQLGAISPNEIRARENMPAREGGDEFFTGPNASPSGNPPANPDDSRSKSPPKGSEGPTSTPSAGLNPEYRSSHERIQRRRDAAAPLFQKQATTVLRREIESLRKAMKAGDVNLEEFYAELSPFVSERFLEAVKVYARTVASEEPEGEPEDFDEWLEGYSENMAKAWTRSSRRQLEAIQADAEDPQEAIETRLQEWEEKRPEKLARRHTVELEGAVKKAVWAAVGVSVIRWRSNPGSCPLCDEMDGMTVGIEGAFKRAGDTVESGDEDTQGFTSKQFMSHPPLHNGCTCTIERG